MSEQVTINGKAMDVKVQGFNVYNIDWVGEGCAAPSADIKPIVQGVMDYLNTGVVLKVTVQEVLQRKGGRELIARAGEYLRTLNDNNRAYQVLVSTVSQATLNRINAAGKKVVAPGWPSTLPQLALNRDKSTGKCKVVVAETRKKSKTNKLTKALEGQANRLAEQVQAGDDVTDVVAKFLAMSGLTADDVLLIADAMEQGETE